MKDWEKRQADARVIKERLKGASLFMHKTRGMLYALRDGSYVSVTEYKTLRKQCGIWWLF